MKIDPREPVRSLEDVRLDCAHYRGEKPCSFRRECPACPHYAPQGTRILIVKLGAMGDALRTTPILPALKARHPESHITWVTDRASRPLLEGIPLIDRLCVLDFETRLALEAQRFHALYSFDKTPAAIALASRTAADVRKGFAMSPFGTLTVFDEDGLTALRLGLSDPFKFHENQRTYQDVLFEAAGIPYRGERYQLALSPEDRRHAQEVLHRLPARPRRKRVGLNTGCGDVFKTKQWPLESFSELAARLHREADADVLLLGGPAEAEQNRVLAGSCAAPVLDTGGRNPVKVFAALVEACDLVVASDTLAMHLAIAAGTPVVALFGSTCPQEIDLYGKGTRLFAGVDCSPCYRHTCEAMTCMKAITPDQVFRALMELLRA